jgi:uncharacterized protein (DUF2267 family)
MLQFNQYVHDGEDFIREVANETAAPWDMVHALRITRAVLFALRKRLTPAESLHLISQLPMLLKAIYVDGWKITNEAQDLRHLDDFIEAVRKEGEFGLKNEFAADAEVKKAIRAVFTVIQRRVSAGEMNDIVATLPQDLRPLLMTEQLVS